MDEIDERVAALLKSPLGCTFLIIAYESGLTPEEIAQPDIALNLGAFAADEMTVWRADHIHDSEAVLQRCPQHAEFARAILREPAADWWFGPLDIAHQVWVPRDGQPPSEAQLVTPVQPPSQAQLATPVQPPPSFERYAQKLAWGFCTSTLIQETSSMFAAIDCGVGDIRQAYSGPPYAFWQMTVDTSARVFEIDGPQAWHNLCVRYPAEGTADRGSPDFSGDKGRLVPDWFAVAADWDAVHLTFGGLLTAEQVRVGSPSGWTYHWAWDYEQTMWLRWMFTSSDRMADHQEPEESGPDWRSLYYLIPHDSSSHEHTTQLRRLFSEPNDR